MRNKFLISFLLLFVFFAACTEEEEPAPTNNNNNNNNNDPIELCDTLKATYDANVASILNSNCTECHSGPSPANGIDLSTYSSAKTIASTPAFLGAINHESGFVPMPFQRPKLDQALIDVLTCWVENGFPEN